MLSEYKRPEPAARPPERRKIPGLPWLCLGAGVVLVVGGVFAWSFSHQQRVVERVDPKDPAMVRLREESLELERQFARICDSRTPNREDLELLHRAIENQREWMQATDSAGAEQEERLAALEAVYQSAWQRYAVSSTQAEEAVAREAIAAGRRDEALTRLRSALDLQRQLNQRRDASLGRDLSRETLLLQEIERLGAEPLAADLAELIARAGKLRDENKTSEALAAYTRAVDLQRRINRDFARTQYASMASVSTLEQEVASLETAGLAADVLALSGEAAEAQAGGHSAEAVALFERAASVQLRINVEYPNSRHISTERLDTLEIARQTELSTEPMRRVLEIDRALNAALQARKLDGLAELLKEGSALNDDVAARLPRSRRLDPELRLKFNYLLVNRERIAPVQAELAEGLRPVPGRSFQILGTEVPQWLYSTVMRANPSRQTGDDMPVESVNSYDAAEFCRRLSWLIGRAARLPTEGEFRAALGVVPPGAPAGQVWSQENSGQAAHPVARGAAGCSDLLGNVAEWLAPASADAETATVAGGSYSDAAAVLAKVPLEKHSRLDRSRAIGFRVVVE